MSLSFDGRQIRLTIKRLMKKDGHRYTDLAKALQLSLPTVKRMLTRDDLPFERLVSIAHWLGMSLSELVELANHGREEAVQFSLKQEAYFAKNPRALHYFHLLLSGWRSEQIVQNFGFTNRETERLQFALEKVGLLEIWNGGRLRLKSRGPYQMVPGGEMERLFWGRAVDVTFQTLRRRAHGNKAPDGDHSTTFFRPFEFVMEEKTYAQMTKEMGQLIEKFRAVGSRQLQLEPREKLKHVTGMIAADFYYCWDDVVRKLS